VPTTGVPSDSSSEPEPELPRAESEALAARLALVQRNIAAALARRGPGPEPTLIGVGKRQPLSKLQAAHRAGLRDFGENYAQELRDKQTRWPLDDHGQDHQDHQPGRWHYIGALQSNKLRYLVGKVGLIHTVDRPSLVAAIDKRAHAAGVIQDFLVEVAIAGEAQKAGLPPAELPALLDACLASTHGAARCVGLMIIPPPGPPGQTRRWFRALRELRDSTAASLPTPAGPPRVALRELSMGMSADYEVAIEEGATLVRVGTAIFGART